MTIPQKIRIEAVETYINNNDSLRMTSKKLGIPHITLWRWVRWYKKGGKKNLKRKKPYKRPWNRPSKKIEKKVMMLKEQNPSLTLMKTQEILENDGIKMSIKGIWGIWKRYALTARSKTNAYTTFGPTTPEAKDSINKIKKLLKDGKTEKAAEIVNKLPSFPEDPILEKIPEGLLSPRRQLDRLSLLTGRIALNEDYKKANKIRKTLEKKGLFYSSILAGLRESLPLNWMMTPTKELELISLLKEKAKGIRAPSIRFILSINEGLIYADYLNYKKAKNSIKKCTKLLKFLPYSFYFDSLGTLLTHITAYKNATIYYKKTMKMENDEKHRMILLWKLGLNHAIAGKYRECLQLLDYAEKDIELSSSSIKIIRAYCAFGQGDILKASSLFKSALEKSEKGNFRNHLHAASLGLAGIQAALGKKKEAETILRKYIKLFRKYRMKQEVLLRNILLKNDMAIKQFYGFPMFHLLLMLQNKKYQQALTFARNNGLLGYLHRIIVFFPDLITDLLEQGYNTNLPRVILNLPVFRKEIPVYFVNFLGCTIIHKNQNRLKTKLTPKDTAFLIFIASSERKSISLKKIYKNFWPKNKKPSRNLAQLLVRLRKALKLPSHFLYIKEDKLFFNCHFTTDYGEYREHIAQAKTLLRAGEWGYAKREYMNAFELFRDEPFKKMYDNWSDDKRLEVLFSYETELLSFLKELKKRGRNLEVKKLIKKAERLLPYSEDIKNFSLT
jgi:transposase